MALPHDQFTVITPLWVEEKVTDKRGEQLRVVKIFMPIACPIKDVIEVCIECHKQKSKELMLHVSQVQIGYCA